MMPSVAQQYGEVAAVEGWRLRCLIGAGYPLEIAEEIAARFDVDLHEAVDLLEKGCLPETAARILL